MPTEPAAGNDEVRQFILSRIREEGPVPFSRFMEWCLYHPQYGYYGSDETRIGKEGDYYTGPCVHPLFGGMVAKQLSQMSRILGGDTFTVLEMGGGRGFLAEDILFWAKKNDPEFYGRLRYLIMERAPSFLREQQDRLSGEVERGKVGWLAPGALTGCKFTLEGCFLSNELVDAFPVHRVVCCGGKLQEIYVGEENGRFVENPGKLSDPRIGTFFPWLGIDLAEGQKAEVNLQALAWLEDVGRCLSRGFIMTIDYGLPAAELYDSRHANGTLRCYFRHQASANPYERPGRQDITSHVDFSALIRKGEELGLEFTGLAPQYRFLIALGLLEEIDARQQKLSAVEGLKLRLSLKHLLEPQRGMGEIFKVLVQHKGIEKPDLEGLLDLRQYFNRQKGGVR